MGRMFCYAYLATILAPWALSKNKEFPNPLDLRSVASGCLVLSWCYLSNLSQRYSIDEVSIEQPLKKTENLPPPSIKTSIRNVVPARPSICKDCYRDLVWIRARVRSVLNKIHEFSEVRYKQVKLSSQSLKKSDCIMLFNKNFLKIILT